MNGKQYAIEKLEVALKDEEEGLEKCYGNIKTLKDEVAHLEAEAGKALLTIASFKDALHKLKGLDTLEKKNIEEKRPASMEKNLLRTETAELYGRSIASYSKRELAAYIIHQSDKILKMLEAK